MSNVNAPNGFTETRRLDGAAPNFPFMPDRYVSKSNTTVIGKGDVIKSLSTGYIDLAVPTDAPIAGIFKGAVYFDTTAKRQIWSPQWSGVTTAVADPLCQVVTDVNAVFRVRSSGTVITRADVGINATFTGNGAPNAITGISTAAIDQTSLSTTNTLPFRVIGLLQGEDNDNASSYNLIEVALNDADYNQLTGV